MDKSGKMLSIKELADMLNVCQKTIRRYINSGKIKSVKLGGIHRISREEVSTLLESEEMIGKSLINSGFTKEFPFPNKVPDGELKNKWSKHKGTINLVSPANKRNIDIIVVGTGLAGASAAATLAELGYNVKAFCFQDSPRRAHSIAAQGGINASKNYQGDGDSD